MAITTCGEQSPNTTGACDHPVTTYEGAVLALRERNGYHDSDFCAVVWDGNRIRTVEYATTRYSTYHNGAKVDATDQVRAAAQQWLATRLEAGMLEAHTVPRKGVRVRSLASHGQAAGIEGVVKWQREKRSRYGTYSYGTRLGIQVEGEQGLRFVDASQVEVIEEPDRDRIRSEAKNTAAYRARFGLW